jgi:hypothetical protein
MPLPRPLWIGIAGVVLILIASGFHVGRPIYRQRVALQEIGCRGGTVQTLPSGPTWLRTWMGDERMEIFERVQVVDFRDTKISDDELEYVLQVIDREIVALDLAETQITDIGLKSVGRMTGLKYLFLDGTHVTDAGLAHLKGLTGVRKLGLERTRVTDAGLENLTAFTQLERLGLSNTEVTDAGLAHLKGLTHLKGLGLAGTHVTDSGVADLQRASPEAVIAK